ncbi:MAG: hypothetical protein HYX78_10225 [Armatimonadetes bacterium]|nr:hypothetical protein [Armatimonadota bacterium]
MARTTKRTGKDKPAVGVSRAPAPVYLLLAVLLLGAMYGRNLSGDTWWHLKTGQWIVEHRALPFEDPFSYTARNPVILHEWGAEVIQWAAYIISPSALAFMSVALISAAFMLAFRNALARSRHLLASFVVTAAGALAAAGVSEMRPQVFSFVFFAVFVLILQRFYERGGKIIWVLPPIILIWVNLHAIFLMGLVLIAIETAIAVISPPEWAKASARPRLASAGPLAAVGVVSALLALINPNGTAPYVYPFHVLGHPAASSLTVEWKSPDFHTWTGRSLLALYAMAALGLASLRGRPAARDFVYVAAFGAASLISRRHGALFAIACAGPIAVWLSSAIDEAASRLAERRLDVLAGRASWGVLAVLVGVLFVWRISDAKGKAPFDYMNTSEVFPSAACDFLEKVDIAGPMFNEYNVGGYLTWRLWPKHRVFVDSRQEPFFDGAFEEWMYASSCAAPGIWQEIFERRGFNFAVLSPSTPLASVLSDRTDWVRVFADDKALIFVRNLPENSSAISSAVSLLNRYVASDDRN